MLHRRGVDAQKSIEGTSGRALAILLCVASGLRLEPPARAAGRIKAWATRPAPSRPVDPLDDGWSPETAAPEPSGPESFDAESSPVPAAPRYALLGGGRSLFGWFRDSLFYTLNPSTPVQGPMLRDGNEHEYLTAIFRAIVRQADARGRKYRDMGDNPAYYGFLIGALTVPYHESHLVHFRQLSPLGARCVPALNSGQSLHRAREPSLWSVFQRYFKLAAPPVVPECSQLYRSQDAVQLVSSGDYFSNGIMQVAINWHVDEYLIPRTYLSVEATLAYGLGVYYNGYDQAYFNAGSYPCLASRNQRMNYFNLVRGAWAGAYNSGNMGGTCRFAHPHDRWAGNDASFLQTLNLVLTNRASLYARHLTGLELNALNEIIANFKNGRHQRFYLDQVLEEAGAR